MAEWRFLSNHARVLVCIAQDSSVRLRDIAAALDISERAVAGIVAELTAAGYLVKRREGRRNYYRVQEQLPLRESVGRHPSIGEVLEVFIAPPYADPHR